jgi:hypothetical protein
MFFYKKSKSLNSYKKRVYKISKLDKNNCPILIYRGYKFFGKIKKMVYDDNDNKCNKLYKI